MAGKKKNLYGLIFFTAVVCLFIFKWNDLNLPYFWDELGVYAQGIDYQVQHTISLAPASVPPLLSRGHPLFFTCINALVQRIFGEQFMVAHLFCFFISLLLLVAIYFKISRYFNARNALVCAVICLIQPIFLAQSGLVLPEILLAFLMFMALCSYYEGGFMLFAFYASLALLTKESAIVLPVVVIFYSCFCWIAGKVRPKGLSVSGLLWATAPYLIFGGFLLVQKQQNGWYFFPFHLESVSFNVADCVRQFKAFTWFIFIAQGRYFLTLAAVAGLVVSAMLNKQDIARRGGFLFLLVLFAGAFMMFNSLFGVYMGRYVTAAVVVFCIVAGVLVGSVSENNLFTAIVLAALLLVSGQYLETGVFNYDTDLGYRRSVHVLQQAVHEVTGLANRGQCVYANFPGYYAFSFDEGGYITPGKIKPEQVSDKDDHYLVMGSPGGQYETDTSKYTLTLLKAFDDGYAHTGVYWARKR